MRRRIEEPNESTFLRNRSSGRDEESETATGFCAYRRLKEARIRRKKERDEIVATDMVSIY